MDGNRVNFTKGNIDSLALPEKKYIQYYDEKTTGLVLRVYPTGAKTFYLYRWIQGKPGYVAIGKYPAVSPEVARKRAAELNAQVTMNVDPVKQKRAKKEEYTLQGAFDSWIAIHAKGHKRTWEYDKWQFGKYLSDWKGRKLSSIKYSDVKILHATLGTNNGMYTANRVLALLTTVFNHSRKMEFMKGDNPCIGVDKFPEEKRTRFIQEKELPRFFAALMKEPDTTARDAILMMLYTGQRRDNVLSMRWNEINFDGGEWTIPREKTKSKKEYLVPLVNPALEILRDRQKKSSSAWVFSSERRERRTNEFSHIKEPKGAWKDILSGKNLKGKETDEIEEITDLHFHDLRRTLASYMRKTGTSEFIIAGMLCHSAATVTEIYARIDLPPIREGMERAVEYILVKGEVKKPGKVKQFRKQA